MKYIIISILLVLFGLPCKNFYQSYNGIYYTSRDARTANVIKVLRDISFSMITKLPKEDARILQTSLEFTSFKELIGDSPNILAWNYDKGREIAIRIYDSRGNSYNAEHIIKALFHEHAHTLAKTNGHGPAFQTKNRMLQKYRDLYVNTLINNTFIDL